MALHFFEEWTGSLGELWSDCNIHAYPSYSSSNAGATKKKNEGERMRQKSLWGLDQRLVSWCE